MNTDVRVLLPDIRSVHNVGSIFRTANAGGVSAIYLHGTTPGPVDRFNQPREDFAKVSLGSEKALKWEFVKDVKELIASLKKEGFQIIALEQDAQSISYRKIPDAGKRLIIVGNEVEGVNAELRSLCDVIAEIPMLGSKESLNVSVAFGIGLYGIQNL